MSVSANNLTIFVYDGPGVGDLSGPQAIASLQSSVTAEYTVCPITPSQVISGEWRKTAALFVMPGGADLPYVKALAGKGNEQIRSFVAAGGSYLGLCAGAYYGAAKVEFDIGGPLEVSGSRELAFFAGPAIGPAYGPSSYFYEDNRGARAAPIRTADSQNLNVYYDGGCYFVGEDADASSLAYYTDLPDSKHTERVAVVACKHGQGLAILCGVHPEFSPESIFLSRPDISEKIKKNNGARRDFFLSLLHKLGVRTMNATP